jgi:hypothetical protein
VETVTAWGVPNAGKPAILFLPANTARHLVGISVGIGSHRRLKLLQIQMVMALGGYRPGAPDCAFRANAARASVRLQRYSGAGLATAPNRFSG